MWPRGENAGDGGRPAPVLLFGAAHLDVLTRSVRPAVLGASNPARVTSSPGGVAFNVARTLSRLGVPATLATALGDDGPAAEVGAAAAGVEVSALNATAGTATYHAILDYDGTLLIGLAAMAAYDELTAEAVAGCVPDGRFGWWVVDANLPEETLVWIADEAHRRKVPLAACAVSPAKAVRLRGVLARVGLLCCNRGEAAALLDVAQGDSRPAADLAGALAERGPVAGFVSDGGNDLAAWDAGTIRSFRPPPPPAIRSVNGAGDALAAGVIYGVLAGLPFFDAIQLGLVAASLKLEVEEPVRADLSPALLQERLTTVATGAGMRGASR